jgi:hypothetical protein
LVGQSYGSSFRVVTLTPPLSREPGEGVLWSRTDKGLFGAESAETAEEIIFIKNRSLLHEDCKKHKKKGNILK